MTGLGICHRQDETITWRPSTPKGPVWLTGSLSRCRWLGLGRVQDMYRWLLGDQAVKKDVVDTKPSVDHTSDLRKCGLGHEDVGVKKCVT